MRLITLIEALNGRAINAKLIQSTSWDDYVQQVSDAYMEAPSFDPRAIPSWKALIAAIERQFDQLLLKGKARSQKYRIEFVDGQPYQNAKEVVADLSNNKRLRVSREANTHPVWTPEQNLKFRAVHDIYGHYHGMTSFEVKGEIAAYNKHSRTLPRAAVPAMFTEVVGQGCAFKATGNFQEQKIVLLPQFDYYNLGKVNEPIAQPA